ncbi:MAG: L-fucose/L-arabinose isomerase family protein [Pirellulales bacterium]|nr:L-fucose/L-arabinose isomerase family protein [Pirellulales bacterium]
MSALADRITLGFIPANRGFFSSELAAKMRKQTVAAMEKSGIDVVVPGEDQTEVGCVQSLQEAELCARLFREKNVRGIVVGAVNFGDEQSVAWTIRKAGLDVPVLIFGCQEEEVLTMSTPRRDAFCGLLSIGDVLRQIDVKYTVARRPICFPSDEAFAADLDWFVRVCRVVTGVKNARYAQIGARPDAFWTCRYNEKQLQRLGATAVVMDLSEAIAGANALADDDPEVEKLVAAIGCYADVSAVKPQSVVRSAKLELFLRRFQETNGIDAFGIQCWTSIQANYGVCSCTTMSRLGDEGTPCACESDIMGTLSMHAAMLASGSPAGLADWNNLHNEDDELANIWHCGVFPASFAKTPPRLGVQEIIASSGAASYDDSQATIEFVARPSPLTLFRVTQDPDCGWHAAVAEGAFEDNPAVTFGGYGWCRIPNLQRLYRDVLLRQFPHHVAITQTHVGNVLWEAFGNYLGMNVYHATQDTPGLYTPRVPF